MKDRKITYANHGNFWTGFGLGSILVLIVLYSLGTKKGRIYLKKIIDIAENWEDHLEILVKEVEDVVKNRKQENKGENSDFVGQLLDKIKSKSN